MEYLILVGVIGLAALLAFRFFGKAVSQTARAQAATVEGIESGKEDCIGGICVVPPPKPASP